MKKFYLIADVRAYATVEAENEDEAWEKGNDLPMEAWEMEKTVYEIWSITEED